jgi:hypothetical protein
LLQKVPPGLLYSQRKSGPELQPLLFANTQPGARFATKTRQAIAFEQMKTRRTHVIVYAGGSFEIFETLSFVHLILALSLPVQARLRPWLEASPPTPGGGESFRNGETSRQV